MPLRTLGAPAPLNAGWGRAELAVVRLHSRRNRSAAALAAALSLLVAWGSGTGSVEPFEPVRTSAAAGGTPASGAAARGDASSPTPQLAGSERMLDLASGAVDPSRTAPTGATGRCRVAYVPAASAAPDAAVAAPMPPTGGVFFTAAELSLWRQRVATGPFLTAGDYRPGSPGDWSTSQRHARAFLDGAEPPWSDRDDERARAVHGSLLRDAAFRHLMAPDPAVLAAVRGRLRAEAANPANDFSQRCLRELDHSVRDAWFAEASWLLRYVVAYDFVRASLGAEDRVAIEAFVRRNAWFFAAQLDYGLAHVFPDRLAGSYRRRAGDAAAGGAAAFAEVRADTNSDCRIDGSDDPRAFAGRNYAHADGGPGPRTSVLSQWFNNRKSIVAAAVGAAGVLLADGELILRGKRYVMEWLTFAVWPDGSEGEFLRNGDYCIAQQGLIYAASNLQAGLLLGRVLARQGDTSLFDFRTRDGLFGTQALALDAPKSLSLVAATRIALQRGERLWYQHEAQREVQQPREPTRLGRMQVHFMADPVGLDDFHELGMLIGAPHLPELPVEGFVLRDPAVTSLPFPGSSGRAVATGFGSWAGSWTDAFNALPAMLLLR